MSSLKLDSRLLLTWSDGDHVSIRIPFSLMLDGELDGENDSRRPSGLVDLL